MGEVLFKKTQKSCTVSEMGQDTTKVAVDDQ